MARIEGVTLPGSKRVEYGLISIFGVGVKTSRDILDKLKIELDTRVKDLSDQQVASIQKEITDNYVTEGDKRKEIKLDITRLQDIKSYRGSRHKKGLPARGQNTKTNARTRKGPRKAGSAVALKKKATKK